MRAILMVLGTWIVMSVLVSLLIGSALSAWAQRLAGRHAWLSCEGRIPRGSTSALHPSERLSA